ncbi:GNAT family N-acetyltransferase [Candidatus Hydrogenedentota bacterium]
MPDNVIIRRFKLADIPRMLEIATNTFTEPGRRPTIALDMLGYLDDQERQSTFVAEQGGRVVGYLLSRYHSEEERFGGQFGVDPECKGHGVGTKLMDSLAEYARSQGIDSITGGTDYASGFYLKYGFELDWTQHKLVFEMVGNKLPEEPDLDIQAIGREDLDELLATIPEPDILEVLRPLFSSLENDGDKCLIAREKNCVKGVVIARTDKYDSDLASVTSLWGVALNYKLQLLDALVRRCSWKGKRFLGVEAVSKAPGFEEFFKALEQRGYKDIPLPGWKSCYWMRKSV